MDNAYTETATREDGGTYTKTSPGARNVFTTGATKAYVETYNNIYGDYPGLSDMGVRSNGADVTALEPGQVGTKLFTVDLPAGAGKTVEIIAGLQSGTTHAGRIGSYITQVTFDADATQTEVLTTPRIIFYGDSIMSGANADNPSLEGVAQLVRNAFTGSVIIEARGYRDLYEDGADETKRQAFADHIAGLTPTIIWLAIGTNDYGETKWSAADFGTAYADLLDKLHVELPDAVIYAQTPIPRTIETEIESGYGNLGAYRTAIANAQSPRSAYCTLVDGTALVSTDDLHADGVHLTTAGHAIYGAAIITALGI